MPPNEVREFVPDAIVRGPDAIRGQPGSLAFIYTKYPDPDGNRWFVRPGYVGHEAMTNTRGMLVALFGPEAPQVEREVVSISNAYARGETGSYAPTGETREVWDWYTIRQFAKRENLFGRFGRLLGKEVVMLWRSTPAWETMLADVLRHLGIGPDSAAGVVVGNDRQYRARDFVATNRE